MNIRDLKHGDKIDLCYSYIEKDAGDQLVEVRIIGYFDEVNKVKSDELLIIQNGVYFAKYESGSSYNYKFNMHNVSMSHITNFVCERLLLEELGVLASL